MFKTNWSSMFLFFFTGVSLAVFTAVCVITKDAKLAIICSAPSVFIEYLLLPFSKIERYKNKRRCKK